MSYYFHVFDSLGRHAKLFVEFLIGNPLKRYVGEFFERRNINLGIVDPDAHVQRVMIHSRVALLHTHLHAVRMARRIKPRPFVHPHAIDHEGIIAVPMTNGVAVPPRRRPFFGVDTLGKFATIGPDFSPDFLVLLEHDHAVGQLRKAHTSCLVDNVARKPQGIARRQRIVGVREVVDRLGLIELIALRP